MRQLVITKCDRLVYYKGWQLVITKGERLVYYTVYYKVRQLSSCEVFTKVIHRYRGGHGFESRWSPDIFQASSFQLLKLENLLRWSLFTFSHFITKCDSYYKERWSLRTATEQGLIYGVHYRNAECSMHFWIAAFVEKCHIIVLPFFMSSSRLQLFLGRITSFFRPLNSAKVKLFPVAIEGISAWMCQKSR